MADFLSRSILIRIPKPDPKPIANIDSQHGVEKVTIIFAGGRGGGRVRYGSQDHYIDTWWKDERAHIYINQRKTLWSQ
jgi:hypothetical protein